MRSVIVGSLFVACGAPAAVPAAKLQPAHAPAPPVSSAVAQATAASPSAVPAESPAPESPAEPPAQTIEQAIRLLRDADYPEVARVIELRVSQTKPKMKLEEEQGVRLARYVYEALPSMPEARALSRTMPKAVVELVRSTYERGVSTHEAESIARYLSHLCDHLKPSNLAALDENCSHVVGREWHEIDYSGEPLSWENQKRIYSAKGIPHFKDAATLERFFRVESQAPYFNKLYRPQGEVP